MKNKRKKQNIVRKKMMITMIFVFLLFIVTGIIYINSALKPVEPNSNIEKKVNIPIGSDVSTISQILKESGIIKNKYVFEYYVKYKNETGFMAGNYVMRPSMTIPEIIDSLKKGKLMPEPVFSITIPEGMQLYEIAGIIAEKTNKSQEEIWSKLNDRVFINHLRKEYPELLSEEILNPKIKYPLEGYLFPATYSFYKSNPSIEEIVSVMLDKTLTIVDKYTVEMKAKNYTVHQLLTMSSLIEEEATKKVDRHLIASVFYNRIKSGMPLQTDPTVLYAKGKHKKRVLYTDLEVDDPYNTYKYQGLTPGPISNAGTSSIDAALMPADSEFLYFLATPEGKVVFSKTLIEHNQKKDKFITGK